MPVFISLAQFSCMSFIIIVIPLTVQIFLYGGYSKEVSSDKSVTEKGIVHSDMWCLDPRTWEWNKVMGWISTVNKFVFSSS